MAIRLNNIAFDADENPAEVTITMSVADAAHIVRHLGKLSFAKTDPASSFESNTALYSCLTSGVFNAYWEDGVDGYEGDDRG